VIVTGTILFILGLCFPAIINALIVPGAKEGAVLQKDTEDKWRGIPGPLGITVERKTYLYECKNRDDVNITLFTHNHRSSTKERDQFS
jgi:hypothetical protein